MKGVEASPAGATREHTVPCQRACGRSTWNHSGTCSACLTEDEGYDAHFASASLAEWREEKAQ